MVGTEVDTGAKLAGFIAVFTCTCAIDETTGGSTDPTVELDSSRGTGCIRDCLGGTVHVVVEGTICSVGASIGRTICKF